MYHYSITFRGGGWKGDENLEYRFSFSVMRKILLEFLFYFNKIRNMFLSKGQQSYCYPQLCNYKEEFVFSNQLNIVVDCNLNFTRSLNASYIEMDG